eukprot:751131-Hanusia_phi.AAC.1
MDLNPVEDFSVGISVLSASVSPECFYVAGIHGLVDELLVVDNPEKPDRVVLFASFACCALTKFASPVTHAGDGRKVSRLRGQCIVGLSGTL